MNEEDEFLLELSEAGVITDFDIEDDGTLGRLQIDWDRFKEYDPIMAEYFWQAHLQEVGERISELTDQGYLDMYFVENEDGTIQEAYRPVQE